MEKLLIFDLDDVLVDTSHSYDEAIARSVAAFTRGNSPVTRAEVEKVRREGGFNDDWELTQELLFRRGYRIDFKTTVATFQSFYLGKNMDGLITNEEWLIETALLDRLSGLYLLAIFTGRPRREAEFVLNQNGVAGRFQKVIAREDVSKLKPDPEGLVSLVDKFSPKVAWYVGNSIDDARAAKGAKIPFIGVLPPRCTEMEEHKRLLLENGAIRCFEDVNEIGGILL
jgi:HAD superfamily hydrolase (TIGR01548 family)